MPPRQKRAPRQATARLSGKARAPSAEEDAESSIYREMLTEAVPSLSRSDNDGKTVKKRRVGGRLVTYGEPVEKAETYESDTFEDVPARVLQTAYTDTAESSDEDMEWEEVELQQDEENPAPSKNTSAKKDAPLELRLDRSLDKTPKLQRRKPVTGVEKRLRLDVHKTHLLCLLGHVCIRNHWCNDNQLQEDLRSMIPSRTKKMLNPDESWDQFRKSETFVAGLKQIFDMWRATFTTSARGMRRAYWAEDVDLDNMPDDFESIPDKKEFLEKAKRRSGSRDLGAQLLCALLRSVAVDARIVCSLQPLPFLGVAKGMTPQKPKPTILNASDLESHGNSTDDASGAENSNKPAVPLSRMRRLGRPEFTETTSTHTPSCPAPQDRPKIIKESAYPVFWIEVFNEYRQKWITFDPIVTRTMEKPSKLEPPMSEPDNNMSYVVAFEEDGSVIDVTRRYTKAFNAKTRKNRVESTKNGERWWRRTMNFFRKSYQEDRDQVEAGELAAKEAREPMPKNVQDFKDHPHYALERHLRRNEVIHPRREVGKLSAGKVSLNKANPGTEPIFRRSDVHVVKSAEGWYRLGREIRSGQQPLKRAAPRKNKDIVEDADDMVEEDPSIGLYAMFQTDVYKPPPVVNGKIPKNIYGNLDVYIPSMVPAGGFHLQHPQGARAAIVLGIDYAEAVAGFEFKGRQGKAVFRGVVIASEYREAIIEVLRAFGHEEEQAREEKRTLRALAMWKRLLLRLRIREQVEDGYAGELDHADGLDVNVEDEDGGGGFFPDAEEEAPKPTAGTRRMPPQYTVEDEDGGFIADEGISEQPETQSDMVRPLASSNFVQTGLKSSARKEKPPRYILHVRSLDEADPYSPPTNIPIPPPPVQPASVAIENSTGIAKAQEATPLSLPIAQTDLVPQPKPNIEQENINLVNDEADAPIKAPSPTKVIADESDSELERASLMSEDPEDEDMEPEWLDDAF